MVMNQWSLAIALKKREALIRLKNSGLAGSIKEKTFLILLKQNQKFSAANKIGSGQIRKVI